MSSAHEYERFLRTALGLKDGRLVGRGEDPAGLADNDVFDEDNIDSIKVGVGYAVEIFANQIPDQAKLSDEEWERVADFTSRVIHADSLSAIASLIAEYWRTVIDRYYEIGTQ